MRLSPLERRRRYFRSVYANAPSLPDAEDSVCYAIHLWLVHSNGMAIRLIPNKRITIMQQLHVDERAKLTLQAVDIYGNIVDVSFENVQWSNSNDDAAADTVSEDGLSLTLEPVGTAVGGETTVDVTATINGTPFSAQEIFTNVAGAVSGMNIVTNFEPKNPPPPPTA